MRQHNILVIVVSQDELFLLFFFLLFASVQTQSPVLQGKMLVPMATVRTAPAPAQQFPIVAPPLPVQNGSQTGSKVSNHFTRHTFLKLKTTCFFAMSYFF